MTHSLQNKLAAAEDGACLRSQHKYIVRIVSAVPTI